jgi:hypothetical protein
LSQSHPEQKFLYAFEESYGSLIDENICVLNIDSENHLTNIKESFQKLNIQDSVFLDYNQGIRSIEPNDMLTYEFQDGS